MNQHTTCQCTNHTTPVSGKYTCLAYVRGNVAYALDALPRTHVELTTGTPWAQATIYLCGTHHTMFINGKAINISVGQMINTIMAAAANYTSKEDTMTNIIIPTTGPEMDDLNAPFITAGEIRLNEIISNNALMENNVPNSPVMGSSVKEPGWAKCTKCSKEIGSDWFHLVTDIRTCMGAAPAPVRPTYTVDKMTGVAKQENGKMSFLFDTSREYIDMKAKELVAEGYKVTRTFKAKYGAKNFGIGFWKD